MLYYCSLCLDEYGGVGGGEDALADELLSDGDGAIVGDAEIAQIVEKARVPRGAILLHQTNERLYLRGLFVKICIELNNIFFKN